MQPGPVFPVWLANQLARLSNFVMCLSCTGSDSCHMDSELALLPKHDVYKTLRLLLTANKEHCSKKQTLSGGLAQACLPDGIQPAGSNPAEGSKVVRVWCHNIWGMLFPTKHPCQYDSGISTSAMKVSVHANSPLLRLDTGAQGLEATLVGPIWGPTGSGCASGGQQQNSTPTVANPYMETVNYQVLGTYSQCSETDKKKGSRSLVLTVIYNMQSFGVQEQSQDKPNSDGLRGLCCTCSLFVMQV